MVLRAEALEGYKGRGEAESSISRRMDISGLFDDPRVTAIDVAVEYSASATGVLRAPFDRRARFVLQALLTGTDEVVLLDVSHATDDNPGSGAEVPVNRRFDDQIISTTASLEDGDSIGFVLHARCTAQGGGQAFGLSEHGFCDFMAGDRRVELSKLRVVFTPILG